MIVYGPCSTFSPRRNMVCPPLVFSNQKYHYMSICSTVENDLTSGEDLNLVMVPLWGHTDIHLHLLQQGRVDLFGASPHYTYILNTFGVFIARHQPENKDQNGLVSTETVKLPEICKNEFLFHLLTWQLPHKTMSASYSCPVECQSGRWSTDPGGKRQHKTV